MGTYDCKFWMESAKVLQDFSEDFSDEVSSEEMMESCGYENSFS
jgi:hypothetical protein